MTTNASNAVGSLETSSAWRVPERVSFWLVQLAPFVLALAAYALAFSVMRPDTTGDEPHYLIAAQSIAFDGDLDLVNDYASPERTLTAYSSFPLSPNAHASDYRDTGQLRPIRGIGMAAMLAPAVALGGLVGARLLMVLIAALVADQLFRLLRDLGFRRRYGILAWAAVALCYPMLVYSSQVYPELPGALLMLVALRVMVRWAASPVALALGSSAAALLVWLHVRFIPLSLGVIVGLVIAACRARRRGEVAPRAPGVLGAVRAAGGAAARYARMVTRDWRTVTVPLAVPYLTYIALFAAVSYHLYGTVHPSAPYRVTGGVPAGSGGWSSVYEFALADVFNPAHGWIPFVPVHWLGLAALGCLVLRWRWAALACIAVPVGYELFIASLAPAPLWQFPARYLIVFIPFIAVPIALAIQSVRAARFVFAPLLAVSLVFAAAAAVDYRHLYPSSDKPRVFGAYAIADLFPVPNAIRFPTSYELFPGQFGPNTGKLEGQYAVARPGDPPDALLYGPLVSLRRGTYLATFQLAGAGGVPDWTAATVDAYSTLPDGVLARRAVKGTELEPRSMSEIELEFSNPGGGLIQTRVFYEGRGTVRAGPVRVVPAGAVGPRDFGRVPDWPKAFAWVIGTVVAGWLLVLGMRRGRSSVEPRADA